MEAFRQLTYKELNLFAGMMTFIHRYARSLAQLLDPSLSGSWENQFKQFLDGPSLKSWKINSKKRPDPLDKVNLIDFQNAAHFTTQLEPEIIKTYGNRVKNWSNAINNLKVTRNYLVHNNTLPLTDEELAANWSLMMNIAVIINDSDLVNELAKLKDGKLAEDERVRFLKEFENERNAYIEAERKKRKLYQGIILCLVAIIVVIVICLFLYHPKDTVGTNVVVITQPVIIKVGDSTSKKQNSFGSHTDNNNLRVDTKPQIVEDYGKYINSSGTDKTNVSVLVIDDKGNILNPLSKSIADIYMKEGKKISIGLLTGDFVNNKQNDFQDLFDGNASMIQKLNLDKYTDYLILGKVKYTDASGSEASGTTVCTAILSVSIISTSTKSLIKSFETDPCPGNDVTESQAKANANINLLSLYQDKYSSL